MCVSFVYNFVYLYKTLGIFFTVYENKPETLDNMHEPRVFSCSTWLRALPFYPDMIKNKQEIKFIKKLSFWQQFSFIPTERLVNVIPSV